VSSDWLFNFYNQINETNSPDLICGGLELVDVLTQKSIFVKPTDHGKGAIGWAVIAPGTYAVKKNFCIRRVYMMKKSLMVKIPNCLFDLEPIHLMLSTLIRSILNIIHPKTVEVKI